MVPDNPREKPVAGCITPSDWPPAFAAGSVAPVGRRSAATAHAGGLKLFAWGLRRHTDVARLAALGVDAVFMDEIGPGAT